MNITLSKYYKYKNYASVHIPREVVEQLGIELEHNEQLIISYNKETKEITLRRLQDAIKWSA